MSAEDGWLFFGALSAFGIALAFGPRWIPRRGPFEERIETHERFFLALLGYALLQSAFAAISRAGLDHRPMGAVCAALIAMGLILCHHLLLRPKPPAAAPLSARAWLMGFAIYALCAPSFFALGRLTRWILPLGAEDPAAHPTLLRLHELWAACDFGGVFFEVYLKTALVVPIAEEVLFRGGLLVACAGIPAASAAGRDTRALALSTLVFALAHQGFGVLPVAMAGLVLGWLYLRTRSIALVIAIHAVHNALVLTLSALSLR